MKFFIACDPPKALSKNSKQLFMRGGFPKMTDGKNVAKAKSTILQLLQVHAPKSPLCGALNLCASFYYPFPSATPQKVKQLGDKPKVTRPDVDGMASGLMDVMTTLRFWEDDSQVAQLTVTKHLSNVPGIHISLEAI